MFNTDILVVIVKDGNTDKVINKTQEFTLDVNEDTHESTTHQDEWKNHVTGKKGGSGSITLLRSTTASDNHSYIVAGASVVFIYRPVGTASGAIQKQFTATINSEGNSHPVSDTQVVTYNFTVNGAITTSNQS